MVPDVLTAHNDVDAKIVRAYRGLITSVPAGTPPDRRNGFRSAHSANRPKGTVSSAPFTTSQFDIAGLWLCRVLRTTRRHEAAFTSGTIAPWLN